MLFAHFYLGLVALQANCKDEDRAVVTGTRNVLRSLGGVAGVAVSTAAYHSVMASALTDSVPEALRKSVLDGTWRPGDASSEQYESNILGARMEGFRTVFTMQIPLMVICFLSSWFIADLVLQGDAKREEPQPEGLQLEERQDHEPQPAAADPLGQIEGQVPYTVSPVSGGDMIEGARASVEASPGVVARPKSAKR